MLARQCHSAEWRERIFFPLSFAFFALARLLATVLFAEQMCWVAFLPALRAVCAARWLAPSFISGYLAVEGFWGLQTGYGVGKTPLEAMGGK